MSEQVQRKRGRPRKSDGAVSTAAGNDFEPAIAVDGTAIPTSLDESGDGIGGDIIDPASVRSGGTGEPVVGGDAPRRRGRKSGSGKRAAKSSGVVSVSGIEVLLLSAHTLLAGITKTPQLELDQGEANMLAKSVAAVAEHYDFASSIVNDKVAAWIALGNTAAVVYGPRVFAIMNERRKNPKTEPPQAGAVVNFPQAG